MNIVFSSDDKYAKLLGVAICSIFENKKYDYDICIYVLDRGICRRNKNRLGILEKKYNLKIKYIKIDTSIFKDFRICKHFTQAAYYRIIIPKIFPNLKKILYFDCDLVILDDLYELYITDIDNYVFAAVEDGYLSKSRNKELCIPKGEKYFNTGVLLTNISKCIEINATETIINFINENPEKLKYVDQDAINATMWGKFLSLDNKYNYTSWYKKSQYLEIPTNLIDIKILHYLGRKPWNYFDNDILIQKYFLYLNKTPWKNYKYINFYREKNRLLFINLVSYFKRIFSLILPRKIFEKIVKIKRKSGIKFYKA